MHLPDGARDGTAGDYARLIGVKVREAVPTRQRRTTVSAVATEILPCASDGRRPG